MTDLQHERITGLCSELKLVGVPQIYGAQAQAAAAKDASFSDFLEETLRGERETRRARARELFARTAGFPAIKTLDSYDFGFATGAPRAQIMELATLGFVERAENVVMLGPSGVGKTQVSTWRSRSGILRRCEGGKCGSRPPPTSCCSSKPPSGKAAGRRRSIAP